VHQKDKNKTSVKNALLNTDGFKDLLHVGELERSIRFVETHALDIRTILAEIDIS